MNRSRAGGMAKSALIQREPNRFGNGEESGYTRRMCGRFTLKTPASELAEVFGWTDALLLEPRYNIAPTQPVLTVRNPGTGRESAMLHWGLIPSWSKDPTIAARMINARGETVHEKPSFRSAFRRRRCLIPADGFYEWQKTGGRTKQPMYITLADAGPFAFAGLWEQWSGADGSEIESCTIITTEANELLADVHHRMPVILPEEAYDGWLKPEDRPSDELRALLAPYPPTAMMVSPVNTFVNSPKNDSPECIKPSGEQRSLFE